MEKDYTTMDFDKISEVIAEWNSIIASFEGSVKKASENAGFQAVISADLDRQFVSTYDASIASLISSLKSSVTQLQSILVEMGSLDDDISKKSPAKNKGGGGNGSSSTTGSSSAGNTTSPTTETLIDNSKEQLESYKNISMNDLKTVAQDLTKYAQSQGKTVEELLSNKEYSDSIKELLLKNQNLSSELKQMITDGKSVIAQAVIKSIFDGKESEIIGLNDNTVLTMKAYLTAIANSNGITMEALINDPTHSELLKTSLKNFGTVTTELDGLSDAGIIEKISKVYDGNGISNMDSNAVSIIRSHVDNVATSNNLYSEEVLAKDTITTEFKNLGKFSVFAENLYGYKNESIISILQSMIK